MRISKDVHLKSQSASLPSCCRTFDSPTARRSFWVGFVWCGFIERAKHLSTPALVEEVETNTALMEIPILQSLLFETFRHRVNPKAPPLHTRINTTRRKGTYCVHIVSCLQATFQMHTANLNVLLQWDKDQGFTHAIYSLENDNLTAHKNSQPGKILY